MFYIADRQGADLAGQSGLLFVSVSSMIFGVYVKSPEAAIITFNCGYILTYCYYFLGAYNLSNGSDSLFLKTTFRS
jgi:hypothetical protein